MQLSFKLLNSNSDINKKILTAIKDHLDGVFLKSIKPIQDRIRILIKDALTSEPEYQSLISGQLKYEFGIPTSQQVDDIINLWIQNIKVDYDPPLARTSSITGGFSLSAIRDDYSDVISSQAASVIDNKSGAVLPWLEWLLLYGGKIIVRNYTVRLGPNPRSRTGMAVMVESNGNNWRVPPQFAGTSNNNWVTRALGKIDDRILDAIQLEIEKRL
jgi:hypothetical protein